MKSLIIVTLIFAVSSFIFKQENKREYAKVEKIEGKEIYLFSEPLHPYKVVEDYNNSTNVISSCNLRNLVDSYLKRAKKDKINFDALIMDTSDNIYLVKFIKEQEE